MFCLQYNLPLPTKVCTKDDFYKIVSSDRVIKKIAEFRQLKAEGKDSEADAKKRSLPIFIYQATFEETESKNGKKACWRRQQAAPKEWFEEGVKNQVMLVHITPSGKGLRVVFKADADIGDLSANQHHLSGLLGVEPDEACKDASRASFAPQQEEILFINDAIFDYQDDVFEEKFGEQYRNGRCKMDDVQHQPSAFSPQTSAFSPQPSYKGIPYADIINEYWQRTGGVPVDVPTLSTNIGNVLAVFLWMANAMCACTS